MVASSEESNSSVPHKNLRVESLVGTENTIACAVSSISIVFDADKENDSTSISNSSIPSPCERKEPGCVSALKLFEPTVIVAVALI